MSENSFKKYYNFIDQTIVFILHILFEPTVQDFQISPVGQWHSWASRLEQADFFFIILPTFLILPTDLKNWLLNTKAQHQNSRNQETHTDTDIKLKESRFKRNNN